MKKLALLLAFITYSIPARASLAVVQAASVNQASTSSGVTAPVTITTTLGNLLVMTSYQDKGNALTPTITDSASQTWTQAGSTVGVNNGAETMWYKANSASVTSVSVSWATYSGTATIAAVVYEISGADTSSPLDGTPATASSSSTGTTLTSGALTTTNTNTILLYGVGVGATTTGWTAGTSFTLPTGSFVSGGGRNAMQYQIVSSTQSGLTTSMTWGTSGVDRIGIFAAFKASGSTTTIRHKVVQS